MSTADFATLVSLASEASQRDPSRRLMKELSSSVSEEVKEVADAITTGSSDSLDADKREYLEIIVELANE